MLRPIRAVQEQQRHVEERLPPVLANRSFLFLWLAQIISQTAQNAILYALIIIVLNETNSAASTSVVVLSFVVPTVLFGVFSGVLVDRWSKRRLLILTNLGRAVAAMLFFLSRGEVWGLYVITWFFASFSQLFTTANAASVPHLVPRKQLISANSLFSGAFTIAQIAGLIVLSPAILKTAGEGPLFIIVACGFVGAALLTRLLPPIEDDAEEEGERAFPSTQELRGAVSEFTQALKVLLADSQSTLAMAHITTSSTLILLFAILVPRYMQAILDVEADNAVAIFAPVAFGALIGLRAVPWVVARLGKTRTVALGMFGLAACLLALGFVETIGEAMARTERVNPFGDERTLFGQSILVALTMGFAGPMGFAYAMLNTPAQTTLHERIPVEMRGRVLASQMVLANGIALVPLVVVGGIADIYGVSSVILAIGVLLTIGGALSLYLDKRWIQGEGGPSSRGGSRWNQQKSSVSHSIDTV
jgi:MFS family permease